MALGDSLNPDCTARTCRVPLLFMSILAKRLHPVGVAARIAYRPPLRWRQSLASLNETGIASDEYVTSLASHWSSISRASHYLCRKRDNGSVHRDAASSIDFRIRATRGSACNALLSRVCSTFLRLLGRVSMDLNPRFCLSCTTRNRNGINIALLRHYSK